MGVLENLGLGLETALTPANLLFCLIGVALGTAVGVLPGIGPTATIAMLLPITFSFEPVAALIMLAGIYYGAQYGGSTTAILINLPGESSAAVTAIDGHEMAIRGRAGPALATADLAPSSPAQWARLSCPVRCADLPRRARVRAGGVLLAGRAGPDRVHRVGEWLHPQGTRNDRPRTAARHRGSGHLFGHPALHLRSTRALRRPELCFASCRHVRRRRDPS